MPPAYVKQNFHPLDFEKEEKAGGKVVAFQAGPLYIAAASIILLVVSAALNIYFYNQFSQPTAYQALLVEKTSLIADNQAPKPRRSICIKICR
jgi:hypothetical protein